MSTDGAVRLAVNTTCARWDDPSSGVGPVAPRGGPLLTKAKTGQVLGVPGDPPSGLASTELYVPSGRPVLFHYMKQQSTSSTTVAVCNGMFAFIPLAGKDYQAIFSQSQGGARCLRGAIDLADPGSKIENLSDGKLCGK